MSSSSLSWNPPVELSKYEQAILRLSAKRKLYRFFRVYRHLLFDDEVQAKLAESYSSTRYGKDALPPAQMALAMLMQAAFDVPDHEVPTLSVVDSRWQVALDCCERQEPLMSQGSVFNFRMRAIEHDIARLLMEKTIAVAKATKGYSATHLRAVFDSSPLAGAGRVEDTFNLIGHAAYLLLKSAAEHTERSVEQLAQEAGIPLLNASSIKAGLDFVWNDRAARTEALNTLLSQVDSLRNWLNQELSEAISQPPLCEQLAQLEQLIEQDTEPDPGAPKGKRRITKGTAKGRQISVGDPEMRHGRKSSSVRINGYKRHIAQLPQLDKMIVAVTVTGANVPDKEPAGLLLERTEEQGFDISEVDVDRAYIESDALQERRAKGLSIVAKPHPVGNGKLLSKEDFEMDFGAQTLRCPAGQLMTLRLGMLHEFPANACDTCQIRSQCTSRKLGRGRSVRIREDEPFQAQLRRRFKTSEGRQRLRERVVVEHCLARIGQTQGIRARYKGIKKNEFDLHRHATLHNCYILNRIFAAAA